MGPLYFKPWRRTDRKSFVETEKFLIEEIRSHKKRQLKLCLVGHTEAGKSSFINSVFSVSRGKTADMKNVKIDTVDSIGTHRFLLLKTRRDLFAHTKIYDTLGLTGNANDKDYGLAAIELPRICEGHVQPGHLFHMDSSTDADEHYCVVFVISANVLDGIHGSEPSILCNKILHLHKAVPDDVSQIIVITKCDEVCMKTKELIENIFYSKKIHQLVKKAVRVFGIPQCRVFPVVNYVDQTKIDHKLNVPILYALLNALDF
ncbi:uncharacterized protein LOC128222279 [Mya arenaria]|uniref:uncharacterized protein LOC128222279 n=1 Tax=Mya arenaria TaxID=6604 RepID=UPI0022E8AA49|nr:uncharacterized protein LOC128222279 [Mya arenaria]